MNNNPAYEEFTRRNQAAEAGGGTDKVEKTTQGRSYDSSGTYRNVT